MKIRGLFLLVFCFWNFTLLAQTDIKKEESEEDVKFSVEVKLVNVSFVVSKGKPLEVSADNIRVKEIIPWSKEEVDKKIEYFNYARELPLRLGILVDSSGSIGRVKYVGGHGNSFVKSLDLLFYEQIVASEVVNIIARQSVNDEKDMVFVGDIFFEPTNPKSNFKIKQDWTNDIDKLLKALNEMAPGGLSPLFTGTLEGISQFMFKEAEAAEFASALVVISDGQNNLANNLRAVISEAHSYNLPIYTIGVAHRMVSNREEMAGNLKSMAELTGGRYFDLPNIEDMEHISSVILNDIQNRYYIGYRLDEEYSGKTGEIKIVIEIGDTDDAGNWRRNDNIQLLHRTGYYIGN